MTTQRTLVSLKEALQQPFAPETIQFLPKDIRTENGKSVCRALPYANKRIYEDRLNALVFGEWSTPATQPYAQGNKLIIPVTVIILGVAHTDYGEAFVLVPGKNGSTREDENTATEAYSQAFRRACAKFLLGRYLYDLPKLQLPYDPKTRQIAISKAERIAWVEKLYMECHLNPRGSFTPGRSVGASTAAPETPAIQDTVSTPPLSPQKAPTPPVATASASPQPASSAEKGSQQVATQPTEYPKSVTLDWVARQVGRDPERIQGICDRYKVANLTQLTADQRTDLSRRLRQQATHARSSKTLQTTH
jgi:hypothetical protein